jgi:succinyl-diaminopimelate desuccinylase
VLDACLDTAPIGDPESWAFPPTVGDIADGWIRGRGSSDSKSGAAIFAHVAAALAEQRDSLCGSLALLFDVDEHTGGFGGAVTAFTGPDALQNVAGVMIGYPGADELVIGGRGVLRARVSVAGVPSHSGSRSSTPNAVLKAADLVQRLSARDLPSGGDFPVPPKLTVTQIGGGEGWSVVPASCTVSVDIRLTEVFDAAAAEKLLSQVVADVDGDWPTTRASAMELVSSWPAYRLSLEDDLVAAVLDGAGRVGLSPRPKVAGPSNIGNYLSGLGIKATAGFGLPYEGLHALDERVRADAIPDIHAAYAHAVYTLMTQR